MRSSHARRPLALEASRLIKQRKEHALDICRALLDRCSALDNERTQARLGKLKCGKEACWPRPHDHGTRATKVTLGKRTLLDGPHRLRRASMERRSK